MDLRDEWREKVAEVVARHIDPPGWMWSASDQMVYACECGDHYVAGAIDVVQEHDVLAAAAWHNAHLADELLAPGGVVAQVAATAWDQGRRAERRDWEFTFDLSTPDEGRQPWPNPYREGDE